MTVQDLIAILETMPPGATVMVNPYDGANVVEAHGVVILSPGQMVLIDEDGGGSMRVDRGGEGVLGGKGP